MKKSFAQVLIAICLFGLVVSTFFYKSKLEATEKELSFCQDTLLGFLMKRIVKSPEYEQFIGERPLCLGDSLLEKHRISLDLNEGMILILEMKQDSSVRLIYRRAKLHFDLLEEKASVEILHNEQKMIPFTVLQEFHKKLAAISFLDTVKNVDYMCCFTTGGLDWEAAYKNGERRKHSTWCRQSVQFASACEYLFQFVDDPILKTHLKGL